MVTKVLIKRKGGAGSGNWGHSGRPGLVGGSSGRGGLGATMIPSKAGHLASWYSPPKMDDDIVDTLTDVGKGDPSVVAAELGDPYTLSHFMRVNSRWVQGADPEAKEDIAGWLLNDPALRALTLYSDYSASDTNADFKKWLDTPQVYWRGGGRSDVFMSFASSERVARDASGGAEPWSIVARPSQLLGSAMTGAGEVYIESEAIERIGGKALLRVKSASSDVLSNATATLIRYNTTEGKTREEASTMEKTASPARSSARVRVKGGAGSGNWGHAGRPGMVGGSAPRSGIGAGMSILTGRDWQMRQAIAKVAGKPKPKPEPPRETMAEGEARMQAERKAAIATQLPNVTEVFEYKSKNLARAPTRTPLTPEQIDTISGWLVQHPAAEDMLHGGLSFMFVANNETFDRLYRGNLRTADAFFRRGSNTVVMRTRHLDAAETRSYYGLGKENWGQEVFHHEVGHAMDQLARSRGQFWIWSDQYTNPDFDRHTSYSRTNVVESFAESYQSYIMNEGVPPWPADSNPLPGSYAHTFDAVTELIVNTSF